MSNIERAYQLINTPIDPNLKCAVELADIVNYRESEPGETVEYFASPAEDRADTTISSIDANGSITYAKVPLKGVLPLTFVGVQSNLETVLLDEVMNSKDQTALAAKKDGIIRSMDNKEIKNVLALILGASSQEVVKATGEDLLDAIIKMKQKISNYATDYVFLGASDVIDAIEAYDKDNITVANYSFPIKEQMSRLGIVKILKVLGTDGTNPVLAAGACVLVGRNSSIATGGQRPVTMLRRKFSKVIAENAGAKEGDVRLVNIEPLANVVNAQGMNTLGYGVVGYESVIQVLLNFRAVCWSDSILS